MTNFPDHVNAHDLWKVCNDYRVVVDVFIPYKKLKAGKRFAFVRFIKVDNIDRLAANLYTFGFGTSIFMQMFLDFIKNVNLLLLLTPLVLKREIHQDKVLSDDPFNLYDILNKRKDSGDDLKGATSNDVNEHVNSILNKLEEFVPKEKLSSNNSVYSKRVYTVDSILQLIDELVKVAFRIVCDDYFVDFAIISTFARDNNRDCYVANRVPIHDWSVVLRRHLRGGDESSQLEALHAPIGNVVLTDQRDSWTWSLNVSLGFFVASVRSLVDARTLDVDSNATRWIRCIPIKINEDIESINHIFFSCDMVEALWDLFAKWWELDIPFCNNIFDWFSWLDSLKVSNKALLWDFIVS
nr:hypothetical protein [Tanacetum cinerariifolium]